MQYSRNVEASFVLVTILSQLGLSAGFHHCAPEARQRQSWIKPRLGLGQQVMTKQERIRELGLDKE